MSKHTIIYRYKAGTVQAAEQNIHLLHTVLPLELLSQTSV